MNQINQNQQVDSNIEEAFIKRRTIQKTSTTINVDIVDTMERR